MRGPRLTTSASEVGMRPPRLTEDARSAFGIGTRGLRLATSASEAGTCGPRLALERDLRVRGCNAGSASGRFASEALSSVIF